MGDKPGDRRAEPSLELPSLFGRRRRRGPAGQEPPAETDPQATAEHASEPAPAAEPVAPAPEPEPTAEPEVARGGRRAERAARRATSGPSKPSKPSGPSRPAVPAQVAAVLTGLLVGLFGAGLTYASLQGCDAVRGTHSCGGPGVFLLLAVLVLMVLAGGLLLAWFRVSEPRSTSFLAVGVTAVVVLVALMEELFSGWMFLAVPAIGAAAYSLAHWVTTRFVETVEPGPDHDVR